MVKTLFVGIAYPPKRDPECIQTGRLLKYLSKSENIELEVITAKPPVMNMPTDDTLKNFDIKSSEIYEKLIRENRYVNYIKSKIGILPFPDLKAPFWRGIKDFAIRNNIKRPDIIYTRAYPVSSVLAGYHLSIHFDVPLIVHFSDPWLLSPLHHYPQSEKEKIKKTELEIFTRASAITFTSKMTQEIYMKEYPEMADKSFLQPNVFDDDSVSGKTADKPMEDKLRIVYTGGIVGNRNPKSIIKAINQLSGKERENIEFLIAGDADRPNRQLLKELNHPQIKYLGLVPFREAIKLQSSAHMLVLFDNVFEAKEQAIYLPSKLLDYFVQRTKVLAITTPGGTTDQVLRDTEIGVSFGHHQIDEIANFLRDALIQFQNKNASYFTTSAIPKEYAASHGAKELEKLILKYA